MVGIVGIHQWERQRLAGFSAATGITMPVRIRKTEATSVPALGLQLAGDARYFKEMVPLNRLSVILRSRD